jgi:hypothetical protein
MAPGAKTCGVLRWMNWPICAMNVQRHRAGAVLERLFVTLEAAGGIWARNAVRRVTPPLVGIVQISSRQPGVALAVADVCAAAIERVERGAEELVADFECLQELFARRQRIQLSLLDVLRHPAVQVGHIGKVGDDGPCRDAGQEDGCGQDRRGS